MLLILILGLLWFIRETKAFLFWLYLWQLKEYHIGRFIDHFRTYKGRSLLLNKVLILKLFLIPLFFSSFFVAEILLLIIYFLESAKFFYDLFLKRFKKPVLTVKTVFLIIVSVIFLISFLIAFLYRKDFLLSLLIFDILTPLIVSGMVLIFQPITVLLRNRIIQKAKRKREGFKDLIVIGITGSYGKTSVKEFLYEVLKEKYKVLKTEANQNSEVGISQCILDNLNDEHEIFIVEMGAYGRGGIKLLCDIAKPKIGVLTGINEQHMSLFGSQDNITKTKFELIESLPENGLAVLNADNEIVRNLEPKIENLQFCSTEEELGFWTKNIVIEKEFVHFRAFSKDGDSAQFKLNLLGRESIENILLVSAVAKELGMSLEEIAKICEDFKQTDPKIVKGVNGVNIIDSTYSANPNGVFSHLNYLKLWPGKKIIIMPCLIELGSSSQEVHREIGKKIAETCDLAIITTKDKFKEIKEGAIEKGMKEEKILFLENSQEIYERIKTFDEADDVVLLENRVPGELIDLLIK